MEFSFHYNETIIKIPYKKEYKMKKICDIFGESIGKGSNLYFLYDGIQINKELTFGQQFKEFKTINKNILVYDRDNIISIKYKINPNDTKVRLFGETFVKNNKKICNIIYKKDKYELLEFFDLISSSHNILEIKLVGIKKVRNMRGIFEGCISLYSLPDISEWKTGNVIDMSFMFYGCRNLFSFQNSSKENIISNFSVINELVESYIKIPQNKKNHFAYQNKDSKKEISFRISDNNDAQIYDLSSEIKSFYEISKWDTKNVTDISFMFAGCESLNYLPDISKWNIKNVKNISGLFASCIRIETIPDITKWDTKNITDISCLFIGCTSLKLVPDFSKWNTENITKINHMFSYCSSLEIIKYLFNNTNKVTNMRNMFSHCKSLKFLPENMSKWNTYNVRNMQSLFEECHSLALIPDISKWRTDNVTDMGMIFNDCRSLKFIPDISNWNL